MTTDKHEELREKIVEQRIGFWEKMESIPSDLAVADMKAVLTYLKAAHSANADLLAENARLKAALKDCLEWMEELRESGDAGFWDWDEKSEYAIGQAILTPPEKQGEA